MQSDPPFKGIGLSHIRVLERLPSSQVAEQELQSLQLPQLPSTFVEKYVHVYDDISRSTGLGILFDVQISIIIGLPSSAVTLVAVVVDSLGGVIPVPVVVGQSLLLQA